MRDRKGFTLIELIIALLISGIVLTIITTFVIYVLNIHSNQEDFVKAQDSVRIAGIKIEKDIRTSSQSIEIINESSCTTISDDVFNAQTKYCLSNHELTRNGDFVAGYIEKLEITHLSEGVISISIRGLYEGRTIEYEQTIYLRTASK